MEAQRHAISWRLTVLVAGAACCSLAAASSEQTRPQGDRLRVVDLLDRYERGDHDGVVADLAKASDIAVLARELQGRGEAWTTPPNATMDMGLRGEQNRETRRRDNDEQCNKKRAATHQNGFSSKLVRRQRACLYLGRVLMHSIASNHA